MEADLGVPEYHKKGPEVTRQLQSLQLSQLHLASLVKKRLRLKMDNNVQAQVSYDDGSTSTPGLS